MIIASAVISTGRKRVEPACRAACEASSPASMRSRAKLTTSTLFAVATPMHMIAPVRAGTLTGVCVRNSIHTIPAEGGRQRGNDDERIEPRLEVHDDQQVDQDDRARQADQQPDEGVAHGLDLAAHDDLRAAREGVLGISDQLVDLR